MAIKGEGALFTRLECKQNTPEWVEARKNGVGGSDVAAIMGLSPWKTPAQVWFEKTGRAEPEDLSGKPYIQFGHDMEDKIGGWYQRRHPSRIVRRVKAMCRSIARPWALASLDYEVRDGLNWGVLEIKTARDSRDWADGVPAYYLTQVAHYLTVTGRKFADVAVFFRDTCEFAEYRVTTLDGPAQYHHEKLDAEDMQAISSAVDEFWHGYVEADVMPALMGTDGEARELAQWHREAGGEYVTPTEDATEAISAYQQAAADEKSARARKLAAANQIKAAIGDNKGMITDVCRVTWSRGTSTKLDTKRLKEERPEVVEAYSVPYVRDGGLRVVDL